MEEEVVEEPVEEEVEEELPEELLGELPEEPAEEEIVEEEPVEPTFEEIERLFLLESPENVLEEEIVINQIIAADENIIKIEKIILDLEGIINIANITQDLFNSVTAATIETDAFADILRGLVADADELDELISFLNQFIIEFDYIDEGEEFEGVNGVIRFDDECSMLQGVLTLDPADEREDFLTLSVDERRALNLTETEREKDPEYVYLKALRDLDVDFCVSESTDITTKNLVGQPEYFKQTFDTYQVSQEGIKIDFTNNLMRDIRIQLNKTDAVSQMFALRHGTEEDLAVLEAELLLETAEDELSEAVEEAVEEAAIGAVEQAVEQAVSDIVNVEVENVEIETIEIETSATEILTGISPYIMSDLENPEQLFTPLSVYQKEAFENVVVYETEDRRKNIVNIFTDDAHIITPISLREYTIYNYGNGLEEEQILFEDSVLHLREDGNIEGYLLDSEEMRNELLQGSETDPDGISEEDLIYEVYLNGLTSPDFVIKTPFVLDRDSRIMDNFSYEITGLQYNRLLVTINSTEDRYPLVFELKMVFTAKDQTYFDQVFETDDEMPAGHFGSSQIFGDFDADGFEDLAISAPGAGSILIYKGGKSANSEPDHILKGPDNSLFGYTLSSDDLNGDGNSDLIVGSPFYDGNRGQAWIFYGPMNGDEADVVIAGAGSADEFGSVFAVSDFNADLLMDLAVSAPGEKNGQGVVYIFYNPDEETLSATDADVLLIGENQDGNRFGEALTAGDFDSDGNYDLAVGAPEHNSGGRVYLFLQDETPWTADENQCVKNCIAQNADIQITGEDESRFGKGLEAADFSQNSKDDLAIGAPGFGEKDEGRVYIFHQNSFFEPIEDPIVEEPATEEEVPTDDTTEGEDTNPRTEDGEEKTTEELSDEPIEEAPKAVILPFLNAQDADVEITGSPGDCLGEKLIAPDFSDDGNADLAAGAYGCKGKQGSVYIFYGDAKSETPNIASFGYIEALAEHDIKWEGEHLSSFGYSLSAGDMNGDDAVDLAVGAPRIFDFKGRSYLFYGEPREELPVQEEVHKAHIYEEEEIPEEELEEELLEELLGELLEEPAEGEEVEAEFELTPEDIEEALEAIEEEAFVLDVTVPENPEIICTGFTDGVYSMNIRTTCGWTDTAGPSEGIYRYCIDSDNTCTPALVSPGRAVVIEDIKTHHTYIRVQTEDSGGISEIDSFDLAHNSYPVPISGPADGGSSELAQTPEGENINFAVTAQDPENDPYYFIICRTSDIPIYIDGKPECSGIVENKYCSSQLMGSGIEASCSYDTKQEPADQSIWYAFVCDQTTEDQEGAGLCSGVLQGSGETGSPFYVQHPARFGKITVTDTDKGTIEPGDRLLFTLLSSEITDVPKGSTVSMHICDAETTSFDYRKDECGDGQLICSSAPTDPAVSDVGCAEALWSSQIPVPQMPGERHFHVFIEHGEQGLVDGDHAGFYTVEDVPAELIDYTNDDEIAILGGSFTEVMFSALLRDPNGWEDIRSVGGVFFDADRVANDCEESRNNCYRYPNCLLTPINETDLRADCPLDVYFNANASQNWEANVNVTDIRNHEITDYIDSDTNREVPPLTAINQGEFTIPYVLTLPGEVSESAEIVLINLGNQIVDVMISGTDLVSDSGIIVREFQKWSIDPYFDYSSDGYPLAENAVLEAGPLAGCADLSLPVANGDIEDVSVYWKVMIPQNQKADLYIGTVSFNPAPDTCLPLFEEVVEVVE